MEYLNSVNLNANTGFPYLIMDIVKGVSVPEPPGFNIYHWHEDFQFIVCYEGETYVHTLEKMYVIKKRCGILINKNVVHFVAGSEDHHYKSFVFPDYFVSFYQGSPANNFVHKLSECKSLPIIEINCEFTWQSEIIKKLKTLARLENKRTEFFPYEVLVRLSDIFLILIKNIVLPEKKLNDEKTKRMAAMLSFIEGHFSEDISLQDIANSAGISKTEATRCFNITLQETPYRYLIEYRLSKATHLLMETDMPIGEIASSVGFNSSSHFGKLFKDYTGRVPKEYRAD